MNRDDVNQMIAQAAQVDAATTEKVLVGLEKVVTAEIEAGGINKFARIIALYQCWKGEK